MSEVSHSHVESQKAPAAGSQMKSPLDESEDIKRPARLLGFDYAPHQSCLPHQKGPEGKMPQIQAKPGQKGPAVTAAKVKADLGEKRAVDPSTRTHQPTYTPPRLSIPSNSGQAAPSNKAASDRKSGPLIDLLSDDNTFLPHHTETTGHGSWATGPPPPIDDLCPDAVLDRETRDRSPFDNKFKTGFRAFSTKTLPSPLSPAPSLPKASVREA